LLFAAVGADSVLDAVDVERPFEFGSAIIADIFVFILFFGFWKLASWDRIHT